MNKEDKQIKLRRHLTQLKSQIMDFSVKQLDEYIGVIGTIVTKRKEQYWQLLEKKRKENFK